MLATILSIISILVVITNFILSILDRGKKSQKENHQELIEYQVKELKEDLKNIASDVKDVKKMLDSYKDTFRTMIKDSIDEHVKLYHTKD
jgi:uncharacterized protein YlxW (UPF0749 family)